MYSLDCALMEFTLFSVAFYHLMPQKKLAKKILSSLEQKDIKREREREREREERERERKETCSIGEHQNRPKKLK